GAARSATFRYRASAAGVRRRLARKAGRVLAAKVRRAVAQRRPGTRPADALSELSRSPVVAPVEGERQPREVAELFFVMLFLMPVLMKVIAQTQVGKRLLHMRQGFLAQCVVHANDEGVFQPAA
nr:hypothetical protein [Tanacetum cinerariifolium]